MTPMRFTCTALAIAALSICSCKKNDAGEPKADSEGKSQPAKEQPAAKADGAKPQDDSEANPSTTALEAGEGKIDVEGGKVWYRIVGSGTKTPVLVVSGGPGIASYYLDALNELASDRPVVIYDQLGCGKSDRPKGTSAYTVERYVKELSTVREKLGLDKVHLVTHSWGGSLAIEHILDGATGIQSLFLASPMCSVPRYVEEAMRLRSQLPKEVIAAYEKHEAAKTFFDPEYIAAVTVFYANHLCRDEKKCEQLTPLFQDLNMDAWETLWGSSEFMPSGALAKYDILDRVGEIKVPTMFTSGTYDEITPEMTKECQEKVAGSGYYVFEGASHMVAIEQPEAFVAKVREFVNAHDN